MTTVAWWHCFSGIAGDMALGSLVDAGVGLDQIERELAALPIGGWALESRPVLRAGLAATQILVHVQESSVVRTHAHIVGLITEARLPPRARQRALAIFALLAEVEGRLHRRPPAQVHFHEVGGIDAIIDIVGTCVALELLGVDEICASAVAQGTGVVRAAHGLLPNPSPAVVELLRDAPTYGTDNPAELTTPTGAALLAALGSGWGPMPAMEITAVGRGAGGRDSEGIPNLVQVVIGRKVTSGSGSDVGQPLVLMESNVDDVTGEALADTLEAVMRAGAADAWITPVIGKKGRPAHVISVLGDALLIGPLRAVLMAETGTLGVRTQTVQRWAASRQVDEVEVDGYPVRVKRSPGRIKAEHDDAARVAARTGRPVRDVARLAEEEAHRGGAGAARPSPGGLPAGDVSTGDVSVVDEDDPGPGSGAPSGLSVVDEDDPGPGSGAPNGLWVVDEDDPGPPAVRSVHDPDESEAPPPERSSGTLYVLDSHGAATPEPDPADRAPNRSAPPDGAPS